MNTPQDAHPWVCNNGHDAGAHCLRPWAAAHCLVCWWEGSYGWVVVGIEWKGMGRGEVELGDGVG